MWKGPILAISLTVENVENVAPLHRQHHAAGEMAADVVLQAVRFVLELVDLAALTRDHLLVAIGHRLEERENLARATHRRPHVLLHGTHRRAAEELFHECHGCPLRAKKRP